MRIQIKVQRGVQYTGRKSRTGKVCFNEEGRMQVFVEYCPDCRGKVTMSLPDARTFARMYNDEQKRPSSRLLRKLTAQRTYAD